MIITAYRAGELSLSQLCDVYYESSIVLSEISVPRKSKAETEFFEDVYDFLSISGSGYCVLESDGRYLCAMRFEPYRDGTLISCLETRQSQRRKGYANELLTAFLREQKKPVYSHVAKSNLASRKLHRKCGFRDIADTAVLLDGTVSSRYATMAFVPS